MKTFNFVLEDASNLNRKDKSVKAENALEALKMVSEIAKTTNSRVVSMEQPKRPKVQ